MTVRRGNWGWRTAGLVATLWLGACAGASGTDEAAPTPVAAEPGAPVALVPAAAAPAAVVADRPAAAYRYPATIRVRTF